jgi:hypothetical protein
MSDPSADFNKVLEQVLKFTETVVDEYGAAEPKTLNWYVCRGKLLALNQVIDYFSAVDAKKFAATAN